MISEVPQFVLRAYALFFTKHGSIESFKQSELDWIVGASMKKKIFSLLLKSGWIKKESRDEYRCIDPNKVFKGLLEFKVPEILKQTEKPYAFTNLSAVEIWSDYSYVQRGLEKSPYFIKVLNGGYSFKDRAGELIKGSSKKILGAKNYDKLRTVIIKKSY